MRRLALSFFGAGFIRPAPGTWGSLAALPAGFLLHLVGGPILIAVGAVALYVIGVQLTRQETAEGDDHDPSWIVIDEVVGQWIALMPVSIGASAMGESPLALWPGVLAAFILFRLFDIWKPWLVGQADRRGDAVGVMLDDVWAGVFAALGGLALAAIAHLGMGV
mgnify:CR=1 FL=1